MGTFTMPGFFVMSGLFIVSSASKPFATFLENKARTIVYPYFVWAVLHCLLQSGLSQLTNHPRAFIDTWRILYQPPGQYWFIYTLFACMLLFAIAMRLRINRHWFFVLATAFYCTRFIPELHLGTWSVVFMVRNSLPFFALGAFIGREKGPVIWMNSARSWQLAALLVATYAFTFWAVVQGARELKWAEPCLSLLGMTGTFSLAILLARSGRFKFFEHFGRRSLEIYVAHVMGLASVRIFLQRALGVEDPVIHWVLGMLGGLYLPILLLLVTERFHLGRLFRLEKPTPPATDSKATTKASQAGATKSPGDS
jgi:fucose 4-O-acetylase-like acetyltransferase